MKKRVLLWIIFLFILNVVSANLITNGNFETGTVSPWGGIINTDLTNSEVHEGSWAVHLTSANYSFQRWITVIPGNNYTLTAWMRIDAFSGSDWGYTTLNVNDDNWQTIGGINNIQNLYPMGQWNKISFTFEATTTRVQVNFGVYGPQDNVDIYVDDLNLTEKLGNSLPTASPTASIYSGSVPLTINFNANADDFDGAIRIYRWEFGDGSESRLENPSHTYYKKGIYRVNLTVYDNDNGFFSDDSIIITVSDATAPTITISSPTTSKTYSTSSSSINLGGTALVTVGSIHDIFWDNINTGEAGEIIVNPSWVSSAINLKPGKNEILITVVDDSGKIDTDKIIVDRIISGPSVSNIHISSSSVRVYEKYEVNFSVDTVAENTFFEYDLKPPSEVKPGIGVNVDALIVLPNGSQVIQPCFYMTDITKSGTQANPQYGETNNKHWTLRFSPQQTGNYDVSIRVEDASGQITVPVGSFTALSPNKKGFVKVSEDDSRYFEYSNGELFWPIGPTDSAYDFYDYSQYVGTGFNFERPWMGGMGAYSTNWARWMSTAENLGNEGIQARLNYNQHYPSSELSQEIFYPEGSRIWMGWGDDLFRARLTPNTNYKVKLRLKLINITGPRNLAVLEYGFTIKNHGWVSNDDELISYTPMIPHINTNRDWHTLVFDYTTGGSVNPYLSLYLDNVNSGEVYIDEFSLREDLGSGNLGPELIRQKKADMHTYVDQRPVAFFDWQVSEGEKYDVFFKYVVQDKNDWIRNHLDTSTGIFTGVGSQYPKEDTKAGWLLQQWYRYLSARLGYSTAVHTWEYCNEGNPSDQIHYEAAQEFANAMHNYGGHSHLATTSFWCCWSPSFWGNETLYPDIDYADIHAYANSTHPLGRDITSFYLNVASPAYSDNVGKPIIHQETGIYDGTGTNNEAPELNTPNSGIWYHNLLWSQIDVSSTYLPGYWYPQHFNQIDKFGVSTPFYNFVRSLDLNKGGYSNSSAVSSNSNLRIFGQKNIASNKAHIWIKNRNHTWYNNMFNPGLINSQSGTVTLQMSPNQEYIVNWYDTYSGAISNTENLNSDGAGDLFLTVNNLQNDVAIKISTQTYHNADSNRNRIIEREELDTYIAEWKSNSGITLTQIIDAIGKWKAGGH